MTPRRIRDIMMKEILRPFFYLNASLLTKEVEVQIGEKRGEIPTNKIVIASEV